MYCGLITSRNSLPAGTPEAVDLDQQLPRDAQALVDAIALVEVGVVDQSLPADRGARLLEVHPHHDLQRVGEAAGARPSACARIRALRPGRGSSRARSPPAGGHPRRCMILRSAARVRPISFSIGVPAIGKKRIRCSGGGSGVTSLDALVVGLAGPSR